MLAVCQAPDAAAKTEAVTNVLLLPQRCLNVREGKGMNKRMIAVMRSPPGTVPRSAVPATAPPQHRRRRRTARSAEHTHSSSVHGCISQGNIRRGAQRLDNGELAPMNAATIGKFNGMFPFSPPAIIPDSDVPPPELSPEDFRACLTRLHNGKAPGLSGWTYEHILSATSTAEGFEECRLFVQAMVDGTLPHIPQLLDSDGLALSKPQTAHGADPGIRPIAIDEAWIRLGAVCCISQHSDLGPSLAPLQTGVSIDSGSESVGHALRAALNSDPDALIISLDCKNALNLLSRQAMFEAVTEEAPSLLPIVSLAYGGPFRVFIRGAPPATPPAMCTTGVRQGHPLGPLFFALTLQGPLRRVQEANPEAAVLAFADDVHVTGQPAACEAAFESLRQEVRGIGSPPQTTSAKCTTIHRLQTWRWRWRFT